MDEWDLKKNIETLSNRVDTLELQMTQLLTLFNRLWKPNEEPHIITVEKQNNDWKSPEFNKDHISCSSTPTDEPQYR